MTSSLKSLYWQSNEDWWRINEETGEFELTEEAPPEAVESFKLFETPRTKDDMKY